MQSKVNYSVVGLFVIVLTSFFLVTIVWMSTIGHGKEFSTYLVYVHEDVTGLSVQSPVRFNGVGVGYVKSLELDDKNPKLVKLVLRIEKHTPITTSTYAILNAQGVTGVVYVNLKAETETAPLLISTNNEPFPVIPSRPSLLMQLSTVLPEITADIQTLSGNVAHVLDAENQQSIKDSLKNIATVTKTFADNSASFSQSMNSMNTVLSNVSKASDGFPNAMKELNQTLASVNQLSGQMKKTSKKISNTMQSGEMVIHNFSNQIVPNAQQALSNLSHATQSVQQLTDELQRDPSMLVRGKAPAALGPGEKQ
ncbi:MAG: MlaD family protein [Gammaproteobacteria bacterium]|nr:MlaD family protein [Gammaproteobacteria bacterium]